MKSKTEKIAFVVAMLIIVGVITAVVFGVIFIKNHIFINKEFITAKQFVKIMEEEDFDTEEIDTSKLDNEYEIKDAYKAKNKNYEIEFYNFSNESDAIKFYIECQEEFDSKSSNKRIELSGNNYDTFTIVGDGKYKFVERIEKTVLVVNAKSTYEKQIEKVLKVLGY